MKRLSILVLCIVMQYVAMAQFSQHRLGITTGLSLFNSKSTSLSYDWGTGRKNFIGIHAGIFSYSENKAKLTLRSSLRLGYAGLHYKKLLGDSRNFSHYVFAAASVGSYKRKMQFMPAAGLQQVFYAGPHVQIFIAEELNYLFGNPKDLLKHRWQPFIKSGLQFRL